MLRTTLDLDGAVLAELRRRQGQEKGKTLGQLASELLAKAFHDAQTQPQAPLQWIARPMVARVDIEDREALQRLIGER